MTLASGSFHVTWVTALLPALLIGIAALTILIRRSQIREMAQGHKELAHAKERGSHNARLQHPEIDLSKCIGCGSCVKACPEDGVLSLLHGQAVVIHGARCVGHGLCAAACPPGAIDLTLGDLSKRRDLPAMSEEFEAVKVPGLFLAGELSGFALVRTAVSQGTAVAEAVGRRLEAIRELSPAAGVAQGGEGDDREEHEGKDIDLVIVGSGPAGIACALKAKELGIQTLVLEQETRLGGTVAAYPRKKMVMTQPMDLPLYGRLTELTYEKEELIALWEHLAKTQQLPVRLGVKLQDLKRDGDGEFTLTTNEGAFRARYVCLALGRRGSPRRLGVPGEDLAKVSYSLLDAGSYQDRRVLVVGGGDSAVEAAVGLSEQMDNVVTLSYRKAAFTRLKARNESRVARAMADGKLNVLFESEVLEVKPDAVRLRVAAGDEQEIPNDDVFVFAGGDPPFALLERAGVSFDPKDRPAATTERERTAGLVAALTLAFLFAMVLGVWGFWYASYYEADPLSRPNWREHDWLRPGGPVGLWCALVACTLFVCNLLYLVRRSLAIGHWLPGNLRKWMGSHVFTGLLAVLCVLMHAGFTMRPTTGGHALLALGIVVLTGALGRYMYAFVPRATNGAEAGISDLRAQLAAVSAQWDREGRGFGVQVREHIDHLVTEGRWRPGFFARVAVLVRGQVKLRGALKRLRGEGERQGIPRQEVKRLLMLAKRAYRLTLIATHYEEVRAVLASWRYFHRWLGLLMVLLAVLHIVMAVRYAELSLGLHWPGRGA